MRLLSLFMIVFLSSCKLWIQQSGVGNPACPKDRSTIEFSGGDGSSAKPYLICDELDLEELDQKLTDPATYPQYGDKHYAQTSHIDLGYQSKSFLPLGMMDNPLTTGDFSTLISHLPSSRPFNGTYDGRGFRINRLFLSSSAQTSYLAFFHHIGVNGSVKNLKFHNPRVQVTDGMMLAVLAAVSQGEIADIEVTGLQMQVTKGVAFAGVLGLLSGPSATARNLSVSGAISGGLSTNYDIPSEEFTSDTDVAAGVIAIAANTNTSSGMTIENLSNSASVASGNHASGVVSLIVGEVTARNLRNTGNIESRLEAGGISWMLIAGDRVGLSGTQVNIDGAYNQGTVTVSGSVGDTTSAAGIAASMISVRGENLINTGTIINDHQIVGGGAGIGVNVENSEFSKIASTGNISRRGNQTDASGNPTGYGDAGGLFGNFSSEGSVSLQNCYVRGHIKIGSQEGDIGGIVGDIWEVKGNVNITNCYVAATFEGGAYDSGMGLTQRGAVIGSLNVDSGLSSAINFNVSNVYIAADLASQMWAGGVYDSSSPDAATLITGASGTFNFAPSSVVDADLLDVNTFAGFDFTNVWRIPSGGGYPVFR